jgi:hypothetical protein
MSSRLSLAAGIFSVLFSATAATAFAASGHGAVPAAQQLQGPKRVAPSYGQGQTLFSESFTTNASTPNAWAFAGPDVCLTAGNSSTPPTSVPACGSNAPEDQIGQGTLELTKPINFDGGVAIYNAPISTSQGVSVTFNYYSYGSTGATGDGLAVIFADASMPHAMIGGCCGSLGYAPYIDRGESEPGLSDGYVAVGLDESGWWSYQAEGRTGGFSSPIPNLVGVRGAAQSNWQYLLFPRNFWGQPAQLPFPLSAGQSPYRPTPLTVYVTLTASGTVSVSIDNHRGWGPQSFIPPTNIVGLWGQPKVPANVLIGFTAAGGNFNARHQINDVTFATANCY